MKILGIQTDSSFFIRSENDSFKKKTTLPKEVREFHYYKDILEELFFKFFNLSNTSCGSNSTKLQLQRSDLRLAINENLKKIKESLKTSMKETSTYSSFLFNTHNEIFQTQNSFLDLAEHLLNYTSELDDTLQKGVYECLTLIFKRGELDLGCMSFDSKYRDFFQNPNAYNTMSSMYKKNDLNYLKSKLKISLKYESLFNKVLKHVLNKSLQCDMKEKDFFNLICVLAYFRKSEFRNKLLSSIAHTDVNLDEWRGNEYSIETKFAPEMQIKCVDSQFSWEEDFEHYVKCHPDHQSNINELNAILHIEAWQKRFNERNETFFSFLYEWNYYVYKKMTFKDNIPWQALPGYGVLIKSFLVELKERDILKYPTSLKQAAVGFLINEKLLNIMVSILYHKTKVYDGKSAYLVFDLINQWMRALLQYKKTLPSLFEFGFFLEGVKKILDQDYCYSIGKCLLMIYNNIHIFSGLINHLFLFT